MKLIVLEQIVEKLKEYKYIDNIYRVENSVIKIIFDKNISYYFDLSRGESTIYKKEDSSKTKEYGSPFDTILQKRVRGSLILNIEILDNDRVIRFELQNSNKYKSSKLYLQLEFTSRATNIIIIDNDNLVIEALRHIDSHISSREIKPSKPLISIPKNSFEHPRANIELIKNLDEYLFEIYNKKEKNLLNSIKQNLISQNRKKLKKLEKSYQDLEKAEDLIKESEKLNLNANIILANIHKINLYDKKIKLEDFDGKEIIIEIPSNMKSVSHASNIIFSRAKRLKNKAKNIHIEEENLSGKIRFYKNLINTIENATNIDTIKKYIQPKTTKNKKLKKDDYASIFIDGYKIMIGRNSRENAQLLKSAKASDIWFHIKDIPSSHVIVKTNKKHLPSQIIEEASMLCVDFSGVLNSMVEVDFTARRNVKIQDGSNVNYINYDTFVVKK